MLGYEVTSAGGLKVSDMPTTATTEFTKPLDPVLMAPRIPLLRHIATTIARCVPSVPAYLGAGLRGDGEPLSGRAARNPDAIYLDVIGYRPAVMATCHHEVWHISERLYMSDDQLSEIDGILEGGQSVWYDDPEYLDDGGERAARAYEHWASMLECGVTMSWGDHPNERLIATFESVYSGKCANRYTSAAA